jgi:hypothetical protein
MGFFRFVKDGQQIVTVAFLAQGRGESGQLVGSDEVHAVGYLSG